MSDISKVISNAKNIQDLTEVASQHSFILNVNDLKSFMLSQYEKHKNTQNETQQNERNKIIRNNSKMRKRNKSKVNNISISYFIKM